MKSMIRTLMVGLALATFILSAAAQESTPVPPEATEIPVPPEATALPEGVVFAAPGTCVISPDETNIAVWGDAVYDLPSGVKRFDLPELDLARYSSDGRFILVHESGLYDAQTGELLIPTENEIYYLSVGDVSPDGRLYMDGNTVYDLNTLEQVATFDRAIVTEGSEEAHYGPFEFVNEGRWLLFYRFDTEQEGWVKMYVDGETWETILDGGDYPRGMDVSFSNDFTRYAVGGEGVFSYPAGEKLFDLPSGFPEFSSDSSVIMVTTAPPTTLGTVTRTYIDAGSGEEINRFETPMEAYAQLLPYGLMSDPTMTRAVQPVITQVGVGENLNPLVRGWQVVEIATGSVLQEFEDVEFLTWEDSIPLLEALYLPTQEDRSVNGRYLVRGEGIFAAETDALILASDSAQLSLSSQGTYAYTMSPCKVWELP